MMMQEKNQIFLLIHKFKQLNKNKLKNNKIKKKNNKMNNQNQKFKIEKLKKYHILKQLKKEKRLMIILYKECMKKDRILHYSLYNFFYYCFQKLKKKPPIINITSKNKITKGNGKMDPEEHKLRVFNRENVPMMPELIIPSFTIKKD